MGRDSGLTRVWTSLDGVGYVRDVNELEPALWIKNERLYPALKLGRVEQVAPVTSFIGYVTNR